MVSLMERAADMPLFACLSSLLTVNRESEQRLHELASGGTRWDDRLGDVKRRRRGRRKGEGTMRHREAFRARLLVVGVVVLGVLVGAPVAAHATTLKVVPIGHGTVSFTPAPQSPDATDPCSSAAAGQTTDLLDGSCAVTYAPGTVVRLQAIDGVADPANDDPATTFRRWSDD